MANRVAVNVEAAREPNLKPNRIDAETPELLETLIAHEARYFEIWSRVTRTSQVWFLNGLDLTEYHSANRALRLRFEQGNTDPSPIVADIIAHYRELGLPVVVDVDPIAEELGFGRALRLRGVTPVMGTTLLMRYAAQSSPELPETAFDSAPLAIARIPNDPTVAATRAWIDLAGCDEDDAKEAALWRAVAEREAGSPDCRLYLASLAGEPVGACQLFSRGGWAQVDSVVTRPDVRRRGIASRLVAQAVRDSLALGNTHTYLYTEQGGAGEQVYRRLGFTVWGIDLFRRHIMW